MAYLTSLLVEAGVAADEAGRRAVLAYAAYLGVGQPLVTVPGVLPSGDDDRRALLAGITDVLVPR